MSFFIKFGRSRRQPERLVWLYRLRDQAQDKSALAAERLGPASLRARKVAGERVLGARRMTAPQLHRAASLVEEELGPRLVALLSATARRVEPPRSGHRIRNTALLVLGGLGVIGIAGALVTRFKFMSDSYDEFSEETEATAESVSRTAPTAVPDSADRIGKPHSR